MTCFRTRSKLKNKMIVKINGVGSCFVSATEVAGHKGEAGSTTVAYLLLSVDIPAELKECARKEGYVHDSARICVLSSRIYTP